MHMRFEEVRELCLQLRRGAAACQNSIQRPGRQLLPAHRQCLGGAALHMVSYLCVAVQYSCSKINALQSRNPAHKRNHRSNRSAAPEFRCYGSKSHDELQSDFYFVRESRASFCSIQ